MARRAQPLSPTKASALSGPQAPPAGTLARRRSIPDQSWAPNMRVPGTPYRIIRPLGAGGMGEVYEVEDERTGRRLALKAIHRRLCLRDALAQRFRDEARVLGRLHDHPNLVDIVYVDESGDGRVYLVMQLLKGCSLEHELGAQHDTPVPYDVLVPWACGVAGQVLDALAAAHAAGILHRDVKPANVFLQTKGPVKLLDFGIAGFLELGPGAGPTTQPGELVGTPAYMAPERLRQRAGDERAGVGIDVFSAGVLLWEMLAGERAVPESDVLAAAARMAREGVRPFASRPGAGLLPPGLVRAIDRATAYEPGQRFDSIEAFAEALREAARGLPAPPGLGPLVGLASAPVPIAPSGFADQASVSAAITREVCFEGPTAPGGGAGAGLGGGGAVSEVDPFESTPRAGLDRRGLALGAARAIDPPGEAERVLAPPKPGSREHDVAYRASPTVTASVRGGSASAGAPSAGASGAAAGASGAAAGAGGGAEAGRWAGAAWLRRGRGVALAVLLGGAFGLGITSPWRAGASRAGAKAPPVVVATVGAAAPGAEVNARVGAAAPGAAGNAAPGEAGPALERERAPRLPAVAGVEVGAALVAAEPAPAAATQTETTAGPAASAAPDAAAARSAASPDAAAARSAAPPAVVAPKPAGPSRGGAAAPKGGRKVRGEGAKQAPPAASGWRPKRFIKVEL